jgi:exoribonuclease R
MSNHELILGKLQAGENFGFFIPDNRDDFGWDFFVNKKNFGWAKDWDLVKAIEIKATWKKPEVKIVSIKWSEKTLNDITIQGTFSFSSEWEWGYVDLVRVIDWKKIDKWYFVHSKNIKMAKSWDQVKAKLQKHKWKLEAIVVKVLDDDREIIEGKYKENWDFGFVLNDNWDDIFVPEKWKNETMNWEIVKVKIIDKSGRRPVGIIIWEKKNSEEVEEIKKGN